jgi:uncharacterized membrane protein YphA (DoxX/SURF4 family)
VAEVSVAWWRSWPAVRPWLATVARLVLAGVFLYAGASKVGDLAESGRAVGAYDLMPAATARAVGAALPFVELALGVLLLVGLATRLAAAVASGLLVVFIAGVSSAWIRGLSIDCGCFGGGGQLAAGQRPTYGWEVTRDVALLLVALLLVVFARSRLSADEWLFAGDDLAEEPDEPADEPDEPAQETATPRG